MFTTILPVLSSQSQGAEIGGEGGCPHGSCLPAPHDSDDKKDAPRERLPALEHVAGLTYVTYYTPDSEQNSSEILLFFFCFLPGVFFL